MPRTNVPTSFAGVQPAWHRIGTVLSKEAQEDYMLAMEEAALNYKVEKIQFTNPFYSPEDTEGVTPQFLDAYGTFRMDTKEHLGTVKSQYEVIQNADAFNFLEELIDGGMRVVSLGSFKSGAVVFANILAKEAEVVKGDPVQNYLQVVTSHDGTLSLDFFSSVVQMVCQNTLRRAMRAAKHHLKINHTKTASVKLEQATAFLRLVGRDIDDFNEKLRFLTTKRITPEIEELFLNKLIGEVPEDAKSKRKANMREAILQSPDNSEVVRGISGTAYALLNRVTNYVDHFSEGTTSPEKRAISAAFGSGDARKRKAIDVLLEMSKTM